MKNYIAGWYAHFSYKDDTVFHVLLSFIRANDVCYVSRKSSYPDLRAADDIDGR